LAEPLRGNGRKEEGELWHPVSLAYKSSFLLGQPLPQPLNKQHTAPANAVHPSIQPYNRGLSLTAEEKKQERNDPCSPEIAPNPTALTAKSGMFKCTVAQQKQRTK